MSPENNYTPLLRMLQQQLEGAREHDEKLRVQNESGQIVQIPPTGKILSSAYEQLRNAAEVTEEHLLLQRAIKRFFNRSFSFPALRSNQAGVNNGEELIIELTQAGYLRQGGFSNQTAQIIHTLSTEYLQVYNQLRDAHVSREDAMEWVLSILSVEVEGLLNPHTYMNALTYCFYQHYLGTFPKDVLVHDHIENSQYEISLYIAVHQAIMKSDLPVVRHDLIRMYGQTAENIQSFIEFNKRVDELFLSKFTQRLKRVVSRQAAPMRILKSMVEEHKDLPGLLEKEDEFLVAFTNQTSKEYTRVDKRLSKGLAKSIVFLLITKVLIGVAIEVPYDIVVYGFVAWLPLAINLLFPPLYMASLKLGIKVPSAGNAQALRNYIQTVLYSPNLPRLASLRDKKASTFSKWVFGILFLAPFLVTLYVLDGLHFNFVQMIIFFVFLSTASFLGFRLSSFVRELELVTHQNGFLSSMRDFFYLPFIIVGQWLSSKYSKINAVGYFLDIAIEMPLKSVLRLVRQWTQFLNEKHDQIY